MPVKNHKQPLWVLKLCKKAAYQGLETPMDETMSYVALARKICSQAGVMELRGR